MQYELDVAKSKIMQFEDHESHVQNGGDCTLRRAGWMKAVINKVCDQLVENWKLDLQKYLWATLAAFDTPKTTHHGRYGGSVHVAATSITDRLKAPNETVQGHFCSSAGEN